MAAGDCERLVATGSPDAPPYSWQDPNERRNLSGVRVALLRQSGMEPGVSRAALHAGEREQAVEAVRSGRMDLLLNTVMQVGQQTALYYIHSTLERNEYLVWTRHDASVVFD